MSRPPISPRGRSSSRHIESGPSSFTLIDLPSERGAFMPIGTVYTVMPIPPEEEVTTYVSAGAVTFGVEVRVVDEALVGAQFKNATPQQQAEIAANKPANLNDGGVSVHVCSSEDRTEYLRFDCFRT